MRKSLFNLSLNVDGTYFPISSYWNFNKEIDHERIPVIEKFIEKLTKRYGITIVHDGKNGCAFDTKKMEIYIPHIKHFKSRNIYYSFLFHEFVHVSRNNHAYFILQEYEWLQTIARYFYPVPLVFRLEEIVAQTTSYFLCKYFSILDEDVEYYSAYYIKNWLNNVDGINIKKLIRDKINLSRLSARKLLNENNA